jgi:phosphonate transport system permease protein
MTLISRISLHRKLILTICLICAFFWSVFSVSWDKDLFNSNGANTTILILESLFKPNLSPEILILGVKATFITLMYASAGMLIAIVISVIFGTLGSGVLFGNSVFGNAIATFSRSFLGFIRAIHELVWAFLFVSSIGLSPYAAVFALGIPYGGILGRILADILADAPKNSILALRTSGASRLQTLFYGYLPMVSANIISYTMYRFECALRSSAIMSFIGIAGIGYQIQLSLSDLKFDEVWTFIFFLVAMAVLLDFWSIKLRESMNIPKHERKKLNWVLISQVLAAFLAITPWIYIISVDDASFFGIFTENNLLFAKKFFASMFGIGVENPAFLDIEQWKNAISLTIETIIMGVLAVGFTAVASLLTVLLASKSVATGQLTMGNSLFTKPFFYLIRGFYIFTRSVPELVWAMLIVFIIKPGIIPGAIALALHNIGILGKLWAEVIDEMDTRPIRNLQLNGANYVQMLFYGVIPSVFPQFLSFLFYRAEVIIRTTIVVGLVGAGGLGQEFKMSMSFFDYTNVTLLLICYIVIVFVTDFLSGLSRKIVK